MQVNRNKALQIRGVSLSDSEEEEVDEADVVNKNSHSWWQAEQERLVKEGLRPPINKKWVLGPRAG